MIFIPYDAGPGFAAEGVAVQRYADPDIKGIVCFIARTEGDPDAHRPPSIACKRSATIQLPRKLGRNMTLSWPNQPQELSDTRLLRYVDVEDQTIIYILRTEHGQVSTSALDYANHQIIDAGNEGKTGRN